MRPQDMTEETQTALADLLTVTALSQVTPLRLQAWQAAARALLAASSATEPLVWPAPAVAEEPADD
jgi:hypothetical protein